MLASAVVVLALVISLVGVLAGRRTTNPPAAPPVAAVSTAPIWSASEAATGVWASVSVTPVTWGSKVHLNGAVSVSSDQLARFEVVTLDGQLLVTVPV